MITAVARESLLPAAEAPWSAPVSIRVQHVSKRFLLRRRMMDTLRHPLKREYHQALNDFSVEVHRGEFFGFLGANGAGKTTLFKILATLISPDTGSVTIEGHDVVRDAGAVRNLLTPVIADERSLRWRLTARENLRLYAVLYNLPARQVTDRVDEVLEVVGLNPADTKLAGRFSSGMKQRLLIARALIPKPRVLLLDEPTRSLDPVSARALRTFLRDNVCRALGCTVLLATHSTEEAFELCDRVAILDRGQPVVIGATEKLLLQYGEDRYRLWTRSPQHPALDQLVERGIATAISLRGSDEDGWSRVDIEIPGGMDRAAQAMETLTARGASVARFEHVGLSLGELIQRVTGRGAGVPRA
jgi:ABC-2 type transport system ATP-binding protein